MTGSSRHRRKAPRALACFIRTSGEATTSPAMKRVYEVTKASEAASRASFVPKRHGISDRKPPKFHGSWILISAEGSMFETKADMSLVNLFANPYEGIATTESSLELIESLVIVVAGRPFLRASCFPSSKNLNLCFPSPTHAIPSRLHREHGGAALTVWHYSAMFTSYAKFFTVCSLGLYTFCFCLRHPSQPRLEGTPGIVNLHSRRSFACCFYVSGGVS